MSNVWISDYHSLYQIAPVASQVKYFLYHSSPLAERA